MYLNNSIGISSEKWYNMERYLRLMRSQYMSRSALFKVYAYIITFVISHTLIYRKEIERSTKCIYSQAPTT
jgi:hypothetical protein